VVDGPEPPGDGQPAIHPERHGARTKRGLLRGRDVILEIDFQGAAQVRRRYPDAVSIFILPPSTAALANRLTGRGEDEDTVIRQRLDKARWEMSHYGDYDYLVVNDDFAVARADLLSIVRAERLKRSRQEAGLESLLRDLLKDP